MNEALAQGTTVDGATEDELAAVRGAWRGAELGGEVIDQLICRG